MDDALRLLRDSLYPVSAAGGRRRFVLVQAGRLSWLVARQLVRDRCTHKAAALAYQSSLSLVPSLVVAFMVLRRLRVFGSDQQTLGFLASVFLPATSAQIAERLTDLLARANLSALGLAGSFTMLVTSFLLLNSVDRVMSDIWQLRDHRPLHKKVLGFVVLLLVAPVILTTSVHLGSRFLTVPTVQRFLAPLGLSALLLFLCYRLLPATSVRTRPALAAAALAALLLEALKVGFNVYARGLHRAYDNVYGTIAYVPVFLVWLYLSWLIVLGGAELAFTIQNAQRLWSSREQA